MKTKQTMTINHVLPAGQSAAYLLQDGVFLLVRYATKAIVMESHESVAAATTAGEQWSAENGDDPRWFVLG